MDSDFQGPLQLKTQYDAADETKRASLPTTQNHLCLTTQGTLREPVPLFMYSYSLSSRFQNAPCCVIALEKSAILSNLCHYFTTRLPPTNPETKTQSHWADITADCPSATPCGKLQAYATRINDVSWNDLMAQKYRETDLAFIFIIIFNCY